mmetsp:Transcript_14901/g.28688  ORF Transcript_14901/g.28688 Transcript_14901/m.28688 type:complete len:223 (-) Transcript_14901:584-1252(-)
MSSITSYEIHRRRFHAAAIGSFSLPSVPCLVESCSQDCTECLPPLDALEASASCRHALIPFTSSQLFSFVSAHVAYLSGKPHMEGACKDLNCGCDTLATPPDPSVAASSQGRNSRRTISSVRLTRALGCFRQVPEGRFKSAVKSRRRYIPGTRISMTSGNKSSQISTACLPSPGNSTTTSKFCASTRYTGTASLDKVPFVAADTVHGGSLFDSYPTSPSIVL